MDTPKWPSFLVEQGADVKAANNNELTPLDGAVGTGPHQFLAERGADVKAKGNDGLTPLHIAARNGHAEVP